MSDILEKIDDPNLEKKDILTDRSTEIMKKDEDPKVDERITPDQPSDGTFSKIRLTCHLKVLMLVPTSAIEQKSPLNLSIADHVSVPAYEVNYFITRKEPKKEQGKFQFLVPNVSNFSGVEYLKSPFHVIAQLPWRLKVKTECSKRTDNKKFLSAYIECNPECDSTLWSCDAEVRLNLLSSDSNIPPVYTEFPLKLCSDVTSLGLPKFIEWSKLMDVDNEHLVKDDQITIQVQIIINKLIGFRSYSEFDFVSAITPGSNSDIILVVEGKRVRVCKHYLSVYSPVFHAMFFSGFSERDQKEIVFEDIQLDEFLELLHVIYPTHKPVTKNAVDYLLRLGDRFEVQFVIEECERFLITTKEVILAKKLVYADQYCLAKLQDACMKTVNKISDLKALKKQFEYKDMTSETKAALLERLLKVE